MNAVLLVLLGALVISLAFAAGRSAATGATALYWAGQALLYLPVAVRVLSPRTDAREQVTLLVALAAAQSLLAWCYSPDQFRFPDELQHVRTAEDILRTHHLFSPNPYLPVSAGFPGMEIVASALKTLTGMSLFHAGLLTASVAHVILPVFVVLFARELIRDARVAGVAGLVYSTAPHYAYFNTLFVYSVIALPFMVLTLRAAVRTYREGSHAGFAGLAFVPVLVTHHLTAFVTVAIVAVLAGIVLASEDGRRRGLMLAATSVLMLLATVAWTAAASPTAFSYLASPLKDVATTVLSHHTSAGSTVTAALPPRWESLVAIVSAAALTLLVLGGIGFVVRSRAPRFERLSALLGLVYPALLVARISVPRGPEFATRFITYGLMLGAVPAAVALARSWRDTEGRRPAVLATLAAALLAAGAIVTGLPPWWERLPGGYHVAAFEAGVDAQVSTVGQWAARSWAPGRRAACDFSSCSMVAGYARAQISTSASPMFYTPTVAAMDRQLRVLTSDYVVVDRRWSTEPPITGRYFFRDVLEGRHLRPYSPALFRKFDADPGADRVYDSGSIRVYDTRRIWGG